MRGCAATQPDFPAVALIVHGGELDDVRERLGEFGVPFEEAREFGAGGAAADSIRLLVTTPGQALAKEAHCRGSRALQKAFHVVVVDRMSRTVRSLLLRSDCDFVVQRPLHPAVLRLLVQRALHTGSERRRAKRAAIGAAVKLRSGHRSREATLVQLSARGCGLLSERPPASQDTVTVVLPRALTGEGALSLRGRVASTRVTEAGAHEIAIVFDPVDEGTKRAVVSVMAARAVGGRPLPPLTGGTEAASRPGAQEPRVLQGEGEVAPSGDPRRPRERRSSARRRFAEPVLAAKDGGTRALVARDLSIRGMRVERDPSLQLGDELKLALHGDVGLRPIVLEAVVARDDGQAGWLLRFGELPKAVAARLERLIGSLPSLGTRADGDSGRPGVLLSEVLDRH